MILNDAYQKISGKFVKPIHAGNLREFCVPKWVVVSMATESGSRFCFSFHCSLEPLVHSKPPTENLYEDFLRHATTTSTLINHN